MFDKSAIFIALEIMNEWTPTFKKKKITQVRCLVVHRGTPVKNVEVPTKTYYHQYLQYRQMASKDFHGVCLDDLMVLEQLFSFSDFFFM
jgi:predicted nuclease of restriction endonuclease-like RecB superfamily